MSDLSETGPIEINRPTKSRYGNRRCTAHTKNGERCKNAARLGGTVCGFHGGRAPAVIAKARERLALAADRMARELLGIATGAESEAVKLAAVKDALDRAGLGAKTEVALELRPYEHILNDVAGVAQITRAESRARRGLPDNTPALDDEPLEVVDAELVDDGPVYPPDATGDARTPAEPPDLPGGDPAPATGPPGRELATLEQAAADAAAVNRRAKVGRVRPVR
jgi:hypothetical protein